MHLSQAHTHHTHSPEKPTDFICGDTRAHSCSCNIQDLTCDLIGGASATLRIGQCHAAPRYIPYRLSACLQFLQRSILWFGCCDDWQFQKWEYHPQHNQVEECDLEQHVEVIMDILHATFLYKGTWCMDHIVCLKYINYISKHSLYAMKRPTLMLLVCCLVNTLRSTTWVDEIENVGCTLHTQLFLKQSWEQKEDPSTMSCLTQVGHRKWAGRSQLTAEQVGSVVSTIVKEAAPPEKNPPSNLCGDVDAACHVGRQSKEEWITQCFFIQLS